MKNFISPDIPPLGTVVCSRCGYPIMMPLMLRQFELRAVIGAGGMGTVYRAYDTTLDREVAVKLMKPELANDTQALEAFCREARSGAALNHTNIIHIYAFEKFEEYRFLVMELADCGSLDGRIEKEKRLPELDMHQ
ncbi:MAG: protein kinase, partial [Candidatus Omnitrophica bacterium]|nr:protein kinase [Candidatus Omnitrophota bacterium]